MNYEHIQKNYGGKSFFKDKSNKIATRPRIFGILIIFAKSILFKLNLFGNNFCLNEKLIPSCEIYSFIW